jgi:hypothetical protein
MNQNAENKFIPPPNKQTCQVLAKPPSVSFEVLSTELMKSSRAENDILDS